MVMSGYVTRDDSSFVYPLLLLVVNNSSTNIDIPCVYSIDLSLITKEYKVKYVGYVYKPFVPDFIDQVWCKDASHWLRQNEGGEELCLFTLSSYDLLHLLSRAFFFFLIGRPGNISNGVEELYTQ